jgi:hypothetical protein
VNVKSVIKIGVILGTVFCNAVYATDFPKPFCVDEILPAKPGTPWPSAGKLRFMEDYSWLRGLESPPYRDSLDPLKAIDLSESGDLWVSFGGSVRIRAEGYENFNFSPSADDGAYWLLRTHLHADVHYKDRIRLFTQIRRATSHDRELPGGNSASLQDEFDLMNFFIDVYPILSKDQMVMLRVGRFEQTYGVGRIIGCTEWSQLRRPVDGLKLRFAGSNWWIDTFAVWPLISEKTEWMEPNKDEVQWGIYGHREAIGKGIQHAEFYILGKTRQYAILPDQERILIGTRLEGNLPRWQSIQYDIEFGYQSGDSEQSVSAAFFDAEIKRSWKSHPLKPTLKAGFAYASGDADPSDDAIKTFEAVAPYGHAYFGFADAVGRQNILSPSITLTLQPAKRLTLRMDYHKFWLDESADGLYSPCNCSKRLRNGFDGASTYVGDEVDLFLKYGINHRMVLLAGYSRLFAGSFIRETGPDEDIRRWYAQLQYNF